MCSFHQAERNVIKAVFLCLASRCRQLKVQVKHLVGPDKHLNTELDSSVK